MMSKTKFQLLLILALVGYVNRSYIGDIIQNNVVDNNVKPNIKVEPDISAFFKCWSDTVRNDKGIIKTNDDWRTAYRQSAKLLIGGTDYVKIPGLDAKISAKITEAIGDKVVDLNTSITNSNANITYRQALADALLDISKMEELQ